MSHSIVDEFRLVSRHASGGIVYHALFFECKRRHFSIKNTTATRPRHNHSTGSTVMPLGLAQPKEQPRLLQQLSRFYLLPFTRKN